MFRATNGIVQLLLLPVLAALLLAALLRFSELTAHLTPLVLIVSAPLLYFAWLLVYLVLCALQIQLLFRSFAKPRRFTYKLDTTEALHLFPLLICYSHVGIIRSLPMGRVLLTIPLVRGLALLACAPRFRLGKQVLLGTFLYDPDLTEIGNNVVVGAGSILSAHAITTTRNGEYVYVSAPIRIGDRAVVGGEARIALGAQVGEDALVEPFSNVLPFTIIPPGEVWGGNPAVFLRKRESTPAHDPAVPNGPKGVRPSVAASFDSAEARRLVAQALNLPASRTAAKKPLDADTCAEWDSLGQLALAAALHAAHGWRYTPRQVAELRSLAAVEAAIREARGETTTAPGETTLSLPADPEWLPLLPSDQATRLLAQASSPTPSRDVVDVVIAAGFTAEPLAAALRPWCAAFGIEARLAFCGYNQITQALLAPDSLFRAHQGGLNVVLLRPEDLPASVAATVAAHTLLDAIRQFTRESSGTCTLAVGTLPPPLSPTFAGGRLEVDTLRADWTRKLTEIEGVDLFDFAGVLERMGLETAADSALDAAARAPFSAAAYRELGIELARLVRRQRRPPAKVLALDGDGVLWGGVLGEDGIDGIQVGADGPGRSFQLFQQAVLRLQQRGVLLVLVSRNEERDVLEVLDRHPGMVLRRQHFAAWRINWKLKSDNLHELAQALNVGLDAFVFIDDDPAVRLQVEAKVPQLHVFPTPADPARRAESLSRLWIFDSPRLTAEDAVRTDMLHHEQARRQQREAAIDLASYLRELELHVEVRPAETRDLPRVAQLTQKTNQLNLSLRRRTLEEIRGLGKDHRILVVSARDRFGDYGQIGVLVLRYLDKPAPCLEIDTFLASCRALGRGVEEAMLHVVCALSAQHGALRIRAPFAQGPRNQPALSFFARSGFRTEADSFILEATDVPLPEHVSLHFQLGGLLNGHPVAWSGDHATTEGDSAFVSVVAESLVPDESLLGPQ